MTEPYLSPNGDLVIPFTCDPRFRWWQDGQDIATTLRDLGALLRVDILRRYVPTDEPPRSVADREAAKIRRMLFEEAGTAAKTRKANRRTGHTDKPTEAEVDLAWNYQEEDEL